MSQGCRSIQHDLTAYFDRAIERDGMIRVQQHLRGCPECRERLAGWEQNRNAMASLPVRAVPAATATALNVLASRRRALVLEQHRAGGRLAAIAARASLWFNNLMRPVAIPAAGGIASALLLFAVLLPTFPINDRERPSDVPTVLYTAATLKQVGTIEMIGDDITVELVIDEDGRVLDYQLPAQFTALNAQLRRHLESTLLYARFQPATAFGQPTAGRVRITLRRSLIEVRG